jgi:hypothetical protein
MLSIEPHAIRFAAMVSKQFKADRDSALKRALHDTAR